MGLYSNYITESSLVALGSLSESVDELSCLNEELDNFNKIVESINVLNENGIILEGLNFSNIKTKIIDAFKAIGRFIKKHIIDPFIKFVNKIKGINYKQLLQKAKSKLSRGKSLEFKPNWEIEDSDKDYFDDDNGNNIEESYSFVNEAGKSKKELQLELAISKLLCPECFFDPTYYCNIDEVAKLSKLSAEAAELYFNILSKAKSKEDVNKDPELEKYIEMIGNLVEATEKSNAYTNIDLEKINPENSSEVMEAIIEDIKKRTPKTISYQSLISVLDSNISNYNKFLPKANSLIKECKTLADTFESNLQSKLTHELNSQSYDNWGSIITSDVVKEMRDIIANTRASIVPFAMIIKEFEKTMAVSNQILISLQTIESIL